VATEAEVNRLVASLIKANHSAALIERQIAAIIRSGDREHALMVSGCLLEANRWGHSRAAAIRLNDEIRFLDPSRKRGKR
jgi:hypothetical protein